MSQLQFRSDDTTKWVHGFGNASAGDASISGTYGSGNGGYNGVCSGTSGAYSLTVPAGWTSYSGPCMIHQSRNGGAGAGTWQLNYIISVSGTTATLFYPLVANFDTTAQIILANQYKNLTVNGTLSPSAWNGTSGGIVFLMAKSLTVSSTINVNSLGFIGGTGNGGDLSTGSQGEGSGGAGSRANGSNGNGGGGGTVGTGGDTARGGGGGGGNATSGGVGNRKSVTGCYGGAGGNTIGNSNLTTMIMGGAGGQGGCNSSTTPPPAGGNGGGLILLIAKNISVSNNILSTGGNGRNAIPGDGGSGGGAGGSILLKCQIATLGSNLIQALGGSSSADEGNGPAGGGGGAGGVGRIHLDYRDSYSGTTNPTIDVTQDSTLNDALFGYPRIL